MTATYKRIEDLLDRWLASLELHARYVSLDDEAYARAQDWPKHQRPTKWVIDLARTRLEEMRQQVASRRALGDERFAESLERMSFLTNLLGSEHIDRFIPLATGKSNTATSGTVKRPRPKALVEAAPTRSTLGQRGDTPRKPSPTHKARATATPSSASTSAMAAGAAAGRAPAPTRPATPARPAIAAPPAAPDGIESVVIADAVRFLGWGREWPALAGLIARLADRPPESQVWKILRTHREAIERQARQPRG